ncbi:putative gustatory receptor 22b [Drosophila subpulchrella]|uniref:putative gustatory receptor 22b n=1 Tax=Drosophila subpulchrella TaxID=1486046 RepID=UPI0018A1992E|nr:putative gustatory receptor 22b [Drosophila subpulchrella]
MFGSRREFRPYLASLILKTVLYGSWLLGLFPFTFDSGRRQLRRSRWLICYGLIMNYFLMFLMVIIGTQRQKLKKLEVFERNPVLESINIVTALMSIISAVVIHFMNFWKSKKVHRIFNELLYLEHQEFKELNKTSCQTFNCFVIQKCLTVMGQLISFLTINYGMPGNEPHLLLVLLSCVLQVSLNLNIMHYYVGILLIFRYVWMINEQLKELVNRMKLNPTTKSSRIKRLLSLYKRLLELNKKLIAAYELHMILILTSWLAGNIVVIYFLIVYGISMRKYSFFLIAFPQSLLINSWDFWLTITICNLTEKAGQKTSTLLKLFTDLDYKDDQLERSVNEFAWLSSHRKFQFKLCGLFSVNYKMGFHMIINSILYLLYLVQFDYMNL